MVGTTIASMIHTALSRILERDRIEERPGCWNPGKASWFYPKRVGRQVDAVGPHRMNKTGLSSASRKLRPVSKLLEGQKALVTGANSGIGEAVAIALGEAGADVAVNYVVAPDRAEDIAAAIRTRG